jgi:diacylglycerol kinase
MLTMLLSKNPVQMKKNNPLVYAILGVINVTRTEKNFKIQILAAILVVTAGIIFQLTALEWISVVICIALVFIAEIFNTALEKLTDLVSPEWNEAAGVVKDISAAAVLVASVISVVCGGIIFLPRLIDKIQ